MLDLILDRGDVDPDLLCRFADMADAQDRPRVGVFFRHPGLVALGDRSYRIDGPTRGVQLEVFAFTRRLEHRENGTATSVPVTPDDDLSDHAVFTQFVVLAPIVGARDRYHERWSNSVSWNPQADGVLVPPSESYRRDGLAITMAGYSDEIGGRLRVEVRNALPYFLSCYSLAALSALPTPTTLHSYFVVVPPGRIARGAEYHSLMGRALARPTSAALAPVDPARMEAALKLRDRKHSRFERQLFALAKVSDEGEPALALVGAMALLEWFLKSASVGTGDMGLAARIRAFGFSPQVRAGLDELRDLRNQLVHEDLSQSGATDGARFDAAAGRRALYVVLDAFREVNTRLG
jgi:hypothetical protein